MIKRYNILYYFILFMAVISSCKKKEDPIPVTETPKLTASINVDGNSISLPDAQYSYLYSSYQKDQNGYYRFEGTFGDIDANPRFKISFKDYKVRATNEQVDIQNAINVGTVYTKDSTTNSITYYKVDFDASSSGGSNLTYNWDFGDGQTSSTTTATTSHLYTNLGTYQVTLSIDDGMGCTNSITKSVSTELSPSCSVDFFSFSSFDTTGGATTLFFLSDSTGTAPRTYSWDFGNGDNSTASSPSTYYNTEGIYTVCVTQTDATSCIADLCKNVAVTSSPPSCIANFSDSYNGPQTTTNTYYSNNVILDWYDDNGIRYSTEFNDANQSIEVVSISDFDTNENGDPTKKVEIQFDCKVYNQSKTTSKTLSGNAIIAVAYP